MSDSMSPEILGKYAKSVDHIAIAVRDLEASIKFYSEVMGYQVRERRETKGQKTAMVSAVMVAGPVTVVLLQGTTPESQVSRFVENYGAGVQHIAIGVENLPAMAEELKGAGMEFDTNIIEGGGLRQIFSHRDPGSGMMFEFIERLGGDFSDESVKNLFEQLEQKDAY
ncbi:MAG: VOC family protein [Acidobacteriota bacterium]